jgi:hypothetical protein
MCARRDVTPQRVPRLDGIERARAARSSAAVSIGFGTNACARERRRTISGGGAAHKYDGEARHLPVKVSEERRAVHDGHLQIAHDDVWRVRGDLFERLEAISASTTSYGGA